MTDQPYLDVTRGQPGGRRFFLGEGTTTLGRAPNATIALRDDQRILSRVHARIARRGDRLVLHAEGANGTAVNGCALGTGAHRLMPGDEIELAGRFRLRFGWAPSEPAPRCVRATRWVRNVLASLLRSLRSGRDVSGQG